MPPRVKVSREEIVQAAVALVRQDGPQALNARALARQLGTSTQPIFSNFSSMEALRCEVDHYADALYRQFLQDELALNRYPPYKASGMAYIHFAQQERELFSLQFLRNRKGETPANGDSSTYRTVIAMVESGTCLDTVAAERLHLEMWACVHGIASMLASSYLELSDTLISEILTDVYQGLLYRFREKECVYESTNH